MRDDGPALRADARFAIYFTPRRQSPLARFGAAWLGRDTATGAAIERFPVPGLEGRRLEAATAEPARYGWHATLKPPFRLARGTTPGELVAHLMGFAAARLPFEIPPLRLGSLDGFLALLPTAVPPLLSGLGIDCLRAFEGFRAPPDAAERERRRRAADFPFHMTLTGRLPEAERDAIARALAPRIARLLALPVAIDAVSLFLSPAAGNPFRELRRFPFDQAG